MKKNVTIYITALVLLAALTIPKKIQGQSQTGKHHHYKLIDLGSFGGPRSYANQGGDNGAFSNAVGNDHGSFTGWADTTTPDPYPNFCFNGDCYVSHAFHWQGGFKQDLGTLPGGASSASAWISANGLVAGTSQNGQIDPLLPGQPEGHAVLWRNGKITDLGVLREGGYESGAAAVNSAGEVTGWATNTIPDPISIAAISGTFFPYEPVVPYQTRAFLWQNGIMRDLGTLGGPDAFPVGINELGQVIGFSYTSSIPNSDDGCNFGSPPNTPTTDPFIWGKDTEMIDIGTLGGTCGSPSGINNRGQVVGTSNLAGDQVNHAFLWNPATGIVDLGTLGGTYSSGSAINDAGLVVGGSTVEGQVYDHTFLWDGKMHDLGVVPGTNCSFPFWINASGQVVGDGGNDCAYGFLWEGGGPMVDLNTLISSQSGFSISGAPGVSAVYINDQGEIFGKGTPAGCDDADVCGHDYVLIPCDENHPGIEGCDYSLVDSAAAAEVPPARTSKAPAAATNPAKMSPRGTGARLRSSLQSSRIRPSAQAHARPDQCDRCSFATVQVRLEGDGSGTVVSSPPGINCPTVCSNTFDGEYVHLTATPLTGSTFVGWGGACSGSGTCSINLLRKDGAEASAEFELPGFALTPANSSLTLQAGGKVTDVVAIAPQYGPFTSAIQLSCALAGPASVPTCTFSPSSVTPGANSTNSTLTITAPSTSATLAPSRKPPSSLAATSLLLGLLGIMLLTISKKERRACSALAGLLLLITLQSACGSSGGSSTGGSGGSGGMTGAPTNYTATITAVSGSMQVSAQISVTLE